MVSVGEPRPTLDHVLLEEGTPYGPVVAIGRPGSAPPFGAARTYVTDDEWRETVSGLCSHAGAVVMTLDETEGVRWELSHLFGQNYERKTLFLLPPRLAPADEAARMMAAALTHWREPSAWAAQISEVAKSERRCCIGWYWKDDGQVEVFTSLRASYLAYLLAVRTFLKRRQPCQATAGKRRHQRTGRILAPACCWRSRSWRSSSSLSACRAGLQFLRLPCSRFWRAGA